MSGLAQYPREKWPPELREAVDRERRYRRMIWPWSLAFGAIVKLFFRRRPGKWRDAAFYDGWPVDELIGRILFLQDAGRHAWAEGEAWRRVVAPISVVVAFAVGLWLGARQ